MVNEEEDVEIEWMIKSRNKRLKVSHNLSSYIRSILKVDVEKEKMIMHEGKKKKKVYKKVNNDLREIERSLNDQ